jgi:hypothetical protein
MCYKVDRALCNKVEFEIFALNPINSIRNIFKFGSLMLGPKRLAQSKQKFGDF